MITNNINPTKNNHQNFKALILKTPKEQCLQDLSKAITNPTKRAAKEKVLDEVFEEIDTGKRYLEHGGMDFTPTAPDIDVIISIKKGQKIIAEVFDKPTKKIIRTYKNNALISPAKTVKKAICAASTQSTKNQTRINALVNKVEKINEKINSHLAIIGYQRINELKRL